MPDVVFLHDVLDAHHLLNLVKHRLTVLEQKREVLTDEDTAHRFRAKRGVADGFALLTIGDVVEDVGAFDAVHFGSPSGSVRRGSLRVSFRGLSGG